LGDEGEEQNMILDLFRKKVEFENIQGYDDIKDIVKRAIDAEDNYNLLFVGPPASAKTLFLLGILESRKGKGAVYFDGSNSTNRILDVLQENRPKIMCIDELDKMPRQFQEKLHVIGKAVWDQRGDIRDVISIGKLVRKNDGPEEVEQILATMIKYGTNKRSNSISGAGSEN
jgi:hypothetical protein